MEMNKEGVTNGQGFHHEIEGFANEDDSCGNKVFWSKKESEERNRLREIIGGSFWAKVK